MSNSKPNQGYAIGSVISELPGHVYWKDREGIFQGCNAQQARSAGFNHPSELVGKTDYDMPWKAQAEALRQTDQQVMMTRQPVVIEEQSLTAEGQNATFLSKKTPWYDEDGNVIGIIGISIDITAEKEAQQLRLEREQNLKHMHFMEALAGSIAHELRTPLAAVKHGLEGFRDYFPRLMEGYEKAVAAGLIEHPIRQGHLDMLKHVLPSIYRQADCGNQIIDIQLMNMNKHKIDDSEFCPCFMVLIIDDALNSYPFSREERALIHWDSNLDFSFYGNALLTKHVLWNLIKNALYFIRAERKGELYIWIEKHEDENTVHIKDTAKGMTAAVQAHIFDEFYTSGNGGSGLGLTFCKIIMQSFGGNISCESEEGKYAEFILHFPLYNPAF
jgi:PAS domain S-box-containing protein